MLLSAGLKLGGTVMGLPGDFERFNPSAATDRCNPSISHSLPLRPQSPTRSMRRCSGRTSYSENHEPTARRSRGCPRFSFAPSAPSYSPIIAASWVGGLVVRSAGRKKITVTPSIVQSHTANLSLRAFSRAKTKGRQGSRSREDTHGARGRDKRRTAAWPGPSLHES